ncbi:MAG: hypothetical protein M0010_21360 [Actinomycetota bacterium]|nr:hypothetical protein [Actinomycetota bacterium]
MSERQLRRQEVADVLRRAGFPELGEEAMRALPDPVDATDVVAWAAGHGVTRDDLIDRMGGSP